MHVLGIVTNLVNIGLLVLPLWVNLPNCGLFLTVVSVVPVTVNDKLMLDAIPRDSMD